MTGPIPIAPSGYVSNSFAAVEALLAGCPTFLALMTPPDRTSTVSAAEALQAGIWLDETYKVAPPRYLLSIPSGEDDEPEAIHVTKHTLDVVLYLVFPISSAGVNTPRDESMLATNLFGALLAEIKAGIRSADSKPVRCRRSWEPPAKTGDNAGSDAGCWDCTITFHFDL